MFQIYMSLVDLFQCHTISETYILHIHVSSSYFYGNKPLLIFHRHWNLLCKYCVLIHIHNSLNLHIPQSSFKFGAMLNTDNS